MGKIITQEMIDDCYIYGLKYIENDMTFAEAKNAVDRKSNMNIGSAHRYIDSLSRIFMGSKYASTVSLKGTRTFFDNIYRDYGIEKLRKAICATKQHISYYSTKGGNLISVNLLCDEYTVKYKL